VEGDGPAGQPAEVGGAEARLGDGRHPGISSANFSGLAGGSITLNATNGVPGGLVEILSTTNIALPFANWIPVLTNNFDLNGNLDIVITANPLTSQEYYILQAF